MRRGAASDTVDGGDAALVGRIAAGDGTALETLYGRHAQRLHGYLFRLLGDWMTAEEVLQDTLLAVWRSAGSYQGRSSVSTWLFGISRRCAYYRLRGTQPPVPAEFPDRRDPCRTPDEVAIDAVGGTDVADAVGRLPLHHREVVILAFVSGLPHAEIAEVLGIPVGTVKSRLHHARSALCRILTETEVAP